MSEYKHVSVLLDECIENLNIRPDGVYVDGTLGLGGHSLEIAKRLGSGRLVCIDRDETAIARASERLAEYRNRITFVHGNFSDTVSILDSLGIGAVDGMLFDLGVSSPQLDESGRGFSYMKDAPLDMRMDASAALTARTIVNEWDENALNRILWDYGEERYARRITAAILARRAERPIETTGELTEIIRGAMPAAALREKQQMEKAADELSAKRKEAAQRFDAAVQQMLQTLGMPKATFKTSIAAQDFTANGADKVEFLLAPNPGEGEKSLQKAVSGGELSRVLLAIKTVMAELDAVPLLIFDEVDSGISGEVGNSIGEALRNLGKHHQVLTITHLHQVASRAQNQLSVSKTESDGRTYTSVTELDGEKRIDELVRMLGGNSATVREHARQLLENNK